MSAKDDPPVRLQRDTTDGAIGAKRRIKPVVQRSIRIQPGNPVAELAVYHSELPTDQEFAVALNGQGQDRSVDIGLVRGVERTVDQHARQIRPGGTRICGEPAADQQFARRRWQDGVDLGISPRAGIKSRIQSAICFESSEAVIGRPVHGRKPARDDQLAVRQKCNCEADVVQPSGRGKTGVQSSVGIKAGDAQAATEARQGIQRRIKCPHHGDFPIGPERQRVNAAPADARTKGYVQTPNTSRQIGVLNCDDGSRLPAQHRAAGRRGQGQVHGQVILHREVVENRDCEGLGLLAEGKAERAGLRCVVGDGGGAAAGGVFDRDGGIGVALPIHGDGYRGQSLGHGVIRGAKLQFATAIAGEGLHPREPGPGQPVELGEVATDQDGTVRLGGQCVDFGVGPGPKLETGIDRTIGAEAGQPIEGDAVHRGKNPAHDDAAIRLHEHGVNGVVGRG